MGSSYPGEPDVLPKLVDEFDRPRASWFNRLLDGIYRVQVELGADPSDLGAEWSSPTTLASILAAFGVMEWGEFAVDLPEDSPVEVNFMNPGRFTEAENMVVFVRKVTDSKGRRLGQNLDIAADVEPSSGPPTGFKFYRYNLTGAREHTERYQYLALEDTF